MGFFKDFFSALWNDLRGVFSETIKLGDNPITTLNIVIWSIYIGFLIGIIITVYNRFVLGSLIRRLIEKGACSESAAVTVADAGCANPFVRFALRQSGTLRRIVYMVGDTPGERSRDNVSSAKFYIPDENIHRAEVIYGNSGTSFVSILLSVLAFFIVVLLSFFVIPNLIQMLTNFISDVTPASKVL